MYQLILNKSFWMLYPENNIDFLKYLSERLLEFIDYKEETTIVINTQNLNTKSSLDDNIKNILSEYVEKEIIFRTSYYTKNENNDKVKLGLHCTNFKKS